MMMWLTKFAVGYLVAGLVLMPFFRGLQGQPVTWKEIIGWLPLISYDTATFVRDTAVSISENEARARKANYYYQEWEYRGPYRR
jgi:hypothetical protein